MDRLVGDRLVSTAKIVEYLLNPDHSVGASKARFFLGYGFTVGDPGALIDALSAHPDRNRFVSASDDEHGRRSVVECRLETPDGRDPCIRSVWMMDAGTVTHRLVTAYPAPTAG